MVILNKVTGEKYDGSLLGSSLILISKSTGIKRVTLLTPREEKIFIFKRGNNFSKVKNRPETQFIPDLVRSIQLEINYLEKGGQKVFLRFSFTG